MAIQTGENWWFPRGFAEAIAAGASDFIPFGYAGILAAFAAAFAVPTSTPTFTATSTPA